MNLAGYCLYWAERLKDEKNIVALNLDQAGKAPKVLAIINKHHISFNVLRVFAVVFLYQVNFKHGPMMEEIMLVLENHELENKNEVRIGINRLLAEKIVKKVIKKEKEQEKLTFIFTEEFISEIDFKI
jgi:hypothetical protein